MGLTHSGLQIVYALCGDSCCPLDLLTSSIAYQVLKQLATSRNIAWDVMHLNLNEYDFFG